MAPFQQTRNTLLWFAPYSLRVVQCKLRTVTLRSTILRPTSLKKANRFFVCQSQLFSQLYSIDRSWFHVSSGNSCLSSFCLYLGLQRRPEWRLYLNRIYGYLFFYFKSREQTRIASMYRLRSPKLAGNTPAIGPLPAALSHHLSQKFVFQLFRFSRNSCSLDNDDVVCIVCEKTHTRVNFVAIF